MAGLGDEQRKAIHAKEAKPAGKGRRVNLSSRERRDADADSFTHDDANDIRLTVQDQFVNAAGPDKDYLPSIEDVENALMELGMPGSWGHQPGAQSARRHFERRRGRPRESSWAWRRTTQAPGMRSCAGSSG